MNFQIGDWVMHCIQGLGQIIAIEERTLNDHPILCYMIQVADLIIWVPIDENIQNRLRRPTNATRFKQLLGILSEPAVSLPTDTRQRNLQLHEMLKDGETGSRFQVIRDLAAYRHGRAWSTQDRELMKTIQRILIGEWSFSLSIPAHEAELELHRSLSYKLD